MRLLAALILLLGLVAPARAQDALPQFAHTSVNDFAGVLTPQDTQTLDEALIQLNAQTGVQGTVVTLPDRSRYGTESLERFARRLFDSWRVGDAERNDGFMVLMVPAAREVRIELGAGYAGAWNGEAASIVQGVMLPAFRENRMSEGLTLGTLALIRDVARPAAAGQPVPALNRQEGGRSLIDGLMPLAVFGVIGLSLFNLIRSTVRRRRAAQCPQCGATLGTSEDVVRDTLPGGMAAAGQRIVTRACPSCGWTSQQVLGVPVVGGGVWPGRWGGRGPAGERGIRASGRGGRSGGFGGGRGGGGGASGRW